MFKIEIKGAFHPDVNKFVKKIRANAEKLMKDAVKEFLMAIAMNDIVKVQTGMSRASLLPLAKQVRLGSAIRSTIVPKVEQKTFKYTPPDGRFPTFTAWKSISHGIKIGERAYILDVKGPIFIFEFDILVYQYHLHEQGVKGSAAWDSLTIGKRAFLEYVESKKDEIWPNLVDWIT